MIWERHVDDHGRLWVVVYDAPCAWCKVGKDGPWQDHAHQLDLETGALLPFSIPATLLKAAGVIG